MKRHPAARLLVDSGLLFEINRKVLHPQGLALEVFAYDQAGTCVFAYLSLEDAMTVTGLGWRTLAGDRKKYRPKFVNGVTYKRSELTIEQLKERS